jgi:hypothetical protein
MNSVSLDEEGWRKINTDKGNTIKEKKKYAMIAIKIVGKSYYEEINKLINIFLFSKILLHISI